MRLILTTLCFFMLIACEKHHDEHAHHDHDSHHHHSHDHVSEKSTSTSSALNLKPVEGTLKLSVSVPPHAWLLKQLIKADETSGKKLDVQVNIALPVGAHPATYQPADFELTQLMKNHAYFRCGVPFESSPWFKSLMDMKLPLIDLREGQDMIEADHDHHHEEHGEEHGEENGEDHDEDGKKEHQEHQEHQEHEEHDDEEEVHLDPHIWASPKMLKSQAEHMVQILNQFKPDAKDLLAENLKALHQKLDLLDKTLNDKLSPLKNRHFLIYHPAWGYFARDYQLTQIALEIEGKQPSDSEVVAFQNIAKQKHLKTIFMQPQMQPDFAKTLATQIGGQVVIVDPLKENIEESMLQLADTLVQDQAASTVSK